MVLEDNYIRLAQHDGVHGRASVSSSLLHATASSQSQTTKWCSETRCFCHSLISASEELCHSGDGAFHVVKSWWLKKFVIIAHVSVIIVICVDFTLDGTRH